MTIQLLFFTIKVEFNKLSAKEATIQREQKLRKEQMVESMLEKVGYHNMMQHVAKKGRKMIEKYKNLKMLK